MNDTVVEMSVKHGRTMHIMGMEHVVKIVKMGGGLEMVERKIESEKKELADMEHSRYNEDHYRNCESCYQDRLDQDEEFRMDAQADEAEFQHNSEED